MQTKNFSIGVLDSGVGGLTVVKEIQTQLPQESIVYFGDSKNMPYGNKDPEEIISLSKKIISFLATKNVKVILLACNTISSQIENLIPFINIPIFDIIYPGCLAAVENNPTDAIGLIATQATVKSDLYGKTLRSFNPKIPFYAKGNRDLARIIEKGYKNPQELEEVLCQVMDPLLFKTQIKNLILGCTHYPIIAADISRLYPNLHLINPAVKLVEIVSGYLEQNNLLTNNKNPNLAIYSSGGIDAFLPFIDKLDIKNYDLVQQALD